MMRRTMYLQTRKELRYTKTSPAKAKQMKKAISIRKAIEDGNSSTNQTIKQKFVGIHVYCNINSLAEYCLKHGYEDSESPINIDDLENYYSYPEWSKDTQGDTLYFGGGTQKEKDEFENEFDRLMEESQDLLNDEKISETTHERNLELIEEARTEFDDLESEPQEVFEWWAISNDLFLELRDRGYVVVNTGSCKVWGRTTTGQAILLDGVITHICADWKILVGQENSWETKK